MAVTGEVSSSQERDELNNSVRFGRNTAALLTGRLVVALAGWAGTVLIARDLGTEKFGQFTLVFSLLGMLSIITDLGVGRVAVAALLDSDEDRELFAGTYILLRTVLGGLGYVLAVLIALFGGFPSPVPLAVAIGGLVVVFATPSHAYEIAFQVRDRLTPLAVAESLAKFGQFGLIVALVLRGGTLVWFVIPAVLNDLAILAWKAPAAHRLIGFRYRIDLGIWWALLKEAVPLSLGAAFVTLYYRLDSVMLSKLDDFEAVGAYGVAYKFVDLVHFVPLAVSVALLAPLTAAWPVNVNQFHQRIDHSLRLLGLAAGAGLVGFWLFARETAVLLYGGDYDNVGLATSIVVSGEVLAFVSTVGITALIAVNRHLWYPVITLTGLGLNIALNLWLIPSYSFEGAAVATLITEAVVLGLLWTRLQRIPGWRESRHVRTFWPLPFAVGAGLATGYGLEQVVHWIPAGMAAVGVYAGVAVALKLRPWTVAPSE
ncbi:MAG: oligosaccharide flippase family protein [Acidimicrobiales bacterium]|nr:oligosaccharide flippase family protein [Acidimicrobiales bacterium]